ncbi:dihydropteroate synthase [Desulfovibrionaceae bacterium]|nr:dihydropteroate synthase [Desulfovibrionaceae bacterium]GKI13399.1 dihydropteroate synthase [Desulfovibrionaceae bacterium]
MRIGTSSNERGASGTGAPWLLSGGRALTVSAPFGVMGIVNLTPDSFYDGGLHAAPHAGLAHALRLHAQGADILDLGAESSRPGAAELSPAEELARLLPVLAGLRQRAPGAVVSVDTYHAATAVAALEQGAVIINDISACAFDPELLDVLVQYKPGYVLMHSRGRPENMQRDPRYDDVRRDVLEFFERQLARLTAAGLPENRIVLDPGIGFGKTLEHNLALLSHPEDWLVFGRPVLMGLSMKSVFGGLLGLPPSARGTATQTATALLWSRGVFWHRVHDVAAARQSLTVAAAFSPESCPIE